MTRDEAMEFVRSMVKNEGLIRHMLALEAVARDYAPDYGGDPDEWGLAGLLHDADWEAYPDKHPFVAVKMLRERGDVPEAVIHAIAAHGVERTQVDPTTDLDKVIYASDELSGFVTACALVRPNRLEDLKPKSVEKRLRSTAFAASCSREDIDRGFTLLGKDRAAHIQRVISAMRKVAPELGLEPVA